MSLVANSQTRMSRSEYIDMYKDIAIREMHQFGIPASITMAQGCLESENGNSTLSKRSNNHFGIKCKGDWTGARVYHNDDEAGECFRKYQYVEESYIDHSSFLLKNSRYAGLFKLDKYDYKGWAYGLKKAGYATDPEYPQKLIKLIEDEKLYLLDKVKPDEVVAIQAATTNKNKMPLEAVQEKITETLGNFVINPYASLETKDINGISYIVVSGGDTYESIARAMGLKTWELYKYNDLPNDAPEPQPNTILFVEKKRTVAQKGIDFHTVKPTETMYGISQKYGVRLNSLYRKNRMEKGSEPKIGQRLYMRKRKPKNQ